jgi:ribosomal-protein-alanine N-acetyltransferase
MEGSSGSAAPDGAALVRLRPLGIDDLEPVARWMGDPAMVAHLPIGPLDRAGTQRYLDDLVAETARSRAGFACCIEDERGEPVGSVVVSVDSLEHRRAELGYLVDRRVWGRGIATAAARLALDRAFGPSGLNRVWSVCDPDNVGSRRVLEKVGMRYEGRLRQDLLVRGAFRDSLLFAVVADDRDAATYL